MFSKDTLRRCRASSLAGYAFVNTAEAPRSSRQNFRNHRAMDGGRLGHGQRCTCRGRGGRESRSSGMHKKARHRYLRPLRGLRKVRADVDAPFRSMLTEYFTTEFTELTELGFVSFTPAVPSVVLCVLCGDENIPRLRTPVDPRNAAAIYFSHSSKRNEQTQKIA